MNALQRTKSSRLKRLAFQLMIVSAAAGGGYLFSSHLWQDRMRKEHEKTQEENKIFRQKEQSYLRQIADLNLQAGTFRFYEWPEKGYPPEVQAVIKEKFVNRRQNPYPAFKTAPLTSDLIISADSLKDGKKGRPLSHMSDRHLAQELQHWSAATNAAIDKGDDDAYLKNSRQLLRFSLGAMRKFSRRHPENLKYLEMDESSLQSEFYAKSQIFMTKIDSHFYVDKESLKKDAHEIFFIENMRRYRKVSQDVNMVVEGLAVKYREEVRKDSVNFERQKAERRDSLLQEAQKPKLPKLNLEGFVLPSIFKTSRQK